jgi:hypothetical protein
MMCRAEVPNKMIGRIATDAYIDDSDSTRIADYCLSVLKQRGTGGHQAITADVARGEAPMFAMIVAV